ncbi:protein NRT1/ PTR FAMILY 1.2-like [Hibiscus syriacus]|uniref:protein NRT1/ PTR FAMILY 1.2-like n=1 Tax=Hibiscus syriacus TaxID=106335 RepID=UPI0019222F78|nr:protein NRT1/ PTR FAMILY 1.2-like [Hibiscus syriacus]
MKEPLLVTAPTSKGGVKALPFIFASEVFQHVASVGLLPNMILYLTTEYGLENAKAANLIFIWSASNQFTPIVGAFLADSYVGRYLMIGFGSIFSFLGMFLLWLTAMFTQARPHCDKFSSSSCESPTTHQLLFLYSSLALISIGGGGIKSSSLAFGADQLTKRNNVADARTLESYFSWYYVFVQCSALIAFTCIVYVQDKLGWKMGFGVPTILMLISCIFFFLASPLYVKLKAGKSLLTGFARVLSASFRNRHIELSSQGKVEIQVSFDDNYMQFFAIFSCNNEHEKSDKSKLRLNPAKSACQEVDNLNALMQHSLFDESAQQGKTLKEKGPETGNAAKSLVFHYVALFSFIFILLTSTMSTLNLS